MSLLLSLDVRVSGFGEAKEAGAAISEKMGKALCSMSSRDPHMDSECSGDMDTLRLFTALFREDLNLCGQQCELCSSSLGERYFWATHLYLESKIVLFLFLQHRSLWPGWWHFWYLCVGNPEGSLWGEVHQWWHFLGWRRFWPGFATVYCEGVQERGKVSLESTVLCYSFFQPHFCRRMRILLNS